MMHCPPKEVNGIPEVRNGMSTKMTMRMKRGKSKSAVAATYNELSAKIKDLPENDTLQAYMDHVMKTDKDLTVKEVLADVLLSGYLAGRREAEREIDEIRMSTPELGFDDLI